MKNIYLLFFCFLASTIMTGQMTVDNSLSPEDVANLLVGEGVSIDNITSEGLDEQFGSWVSDGTDIVIEEGIILATGDCFMAQGENNSTGATLGGGSFGAGDPDLTILAGVNTNDKAVLEFDFIPLGTEVTFRYVFGSEEYDDFQCCSVNDAFGFFISGPGITGPFSSPAEFPDGSINLALIPGSDVGVSINTVNSGIANCSEAQCSDLDPNWEDNVIYYTSNIGGLSVQYDGFTVVMTATAEVVCGETYHLKMAIADGGDTILDSGVFIESGSLNATAGAIEVDIDATGFELDENELIEGCLGGTIVINRASCSEEEIVTLEIGGTATSGEDYEPIPTEIIFDDENSSFEIDLETFYDGIDEGIETIEISFEYENGLGGLDTAYATITIFDYLDMTLNVDDLYLCPGADGTPIVDLQNGVPVYEFDWSDGQDGPNPTFSADNAGNYSVAVSDRCNENITASFEVIDPPAYQAIIPDPYYCLGTTTENLVSGGSPAYIYDFENDSLILSGTSTFTASFEGIYDVTITDQCNLEYNFELIFENCGTVIPNIFTPNNDLLNEYFIIEGLHSFPNSEILIYNRWGNLIYEDTNYQNNWDGDDKSEGTYYYILKRSDGETFSGYFQIVK